MPSARTGEVTPQASLAAAFPESAVLGERLVELGLSIAVAESCTGGLLGAALTAVPGSSRYMRGGIIAYSDAVKVELLGVGEELLGRLGAVSAEVAAAMAGSVAGRLEADLGLAITGVAGPGAEGTSKPVGLIYVAGCLGARVEVVELRERGDREANRAAAVNAALRLGSTLVAAGGPAAPPVAGR